MILFIRVIYLVLTLGVLTGIFFNVQNYEPSKMLIIAFLSVVSIFCYIANTRSSNTLKNKILKPSVLLLFGLCIIVFQNIIDLSIGNLGTDATVFYIPQVITKGVAYGAIAIVAYIMGYTSTNATFAEQKSPEEVVPLRLLVALYVLFYVLFLSSLNQDFFSGQAYVDSGDISKSHTNNSEVLLSICSIAILVQYAINTRGQSLSFVKFLHGLPKIFISLFVLYIVLRLISGARFPVLRDVLMLFFSYVYASRKQPIKNIMTIALISVASIVFSLISYSRVFITDDLSEKYTLGKQGFENNLSFSPTTAELAGSQYCDMLAIDIFENKGVPHKYGAIQARYLSVIVIPNRILQQIWHVPVEMQGSAYFLTAKDRGADAEVGLGTTLYTDFYLDFGVIGMIICMILVGSLFKHIDLALYSSVENIYPIFIVVLMIYLSACSFYLSRSSFIPMIRMPIYAFILMKINIFCNRR